MEPEAPGTQCCVLYDYVAGQEDELSVRQGEVLSVLGYSKDNDGWLLACDVSAPERRGIVPGNYLSGKLDQASLAYVETMDLANRTGRHPDGFFDQYRDWLMGLTGIQDTERELDMHEAVDQASVTAGGPDGSGVAGVAGAGAGAGAAESFSTAARPGRPRSLTTPSGPAPPSPTAAAARSRTETAPTAAPRPRSNTARRRPAPLPPGPRQLQQLHQRRQVLPDPSAQQQQRPARRDSSNSSHTSAAPVWSPAPGAGLPREGRGRPVGSSFSNGAGGAGSGGGGGAGGDQHKARRRAPNPPTSAPPRSRQEGVPSTSPEARDNPAALPTQTSGSSGATLVSRDRQSVISGAEEIQRWAGGMEWDASLGSERDSLERRSSTGGDSVDSLHFDVSRWVIPLHDVTIGRCIGRGGFSQVFEGSWNGRRLAVKRLIHLDSTELATQRLTHEATFLSRLSHDNVVRFIGLLTEAPVFALVTEFCQGGSLSALLARKTLDPPTLISWVRQIAEGMRYLSSRRKPIVHRDLKSMNILLDRSLANPLTTCKIADLGLAKHLVSGRTTNMSTAGTFAFMSPELIRQSRYSLKSDVWSYGVVCWEMLTGEVAYGKLDGLAVAYGVATSSISLPIPSSAPPFFRHLLERCWSFDAHERPHFLEIVNMLETAMTACGDGAETSVAAAAAVAAATAAVSGSCTANGDVSANGPTAAAVGAGAGAGVAGNFAGEALAFSTLPNEQFREMQREWGSEVQREWDTIREKEAYLRSREEELRAAEAEQEKRLEELRLLERKLRQREEKLVEREVKAILSPRNSDRDLGGHGAHGGGNHAGSGVGGAHGGGGSGGASGNMGSAASAGPGNGDGGWFEGGIFTFRRSSASRPPQKPRRARRLSQGAISHPFNFEHISHVGRESFADTSEAGSSEPAHSPMPHTSAG